MAGQTIAGLFKDQARGEKALAELKAANFPSAQISEVADHNDTSVAPDETGQSDYRLLQRSYNHGLRIP